MALEHLQPAGVRADITDPLAPPGPLWHHGPVGFEGGQVMLMAELFAGAGTGLLLGLLLGLAASPVVGVVVGALAALLAALVGVQLPGRGDAPSPNQRRAGHWRAAAFSLACVLGVLGGLYIRTHDLLSPAPHSLQQRVDELTGIGFSASEARRIVVLHKLDDTPIAAATPTAPSSKSLLFAAQAERCERLNPERFKDLAATVAAYRAMDEPAMARVAQAISNQAGDEAARMDLLRAVLEAVCAKP